MSGFEDAISHSRKTDIVSPSPAVKGTLGSNPMFQGDGRTGISSSHANQAIDMTRVKGAASKAVIAYQRADAPDGESIKEEKQIGGLPLNMTASTGTDEYAYEPPMQAAAAINASRAQKGEIYPCYPDAQGGDLGMSAGHKNPQTK